MRYLYIQNMHISIWLQASFLSQPNIYSAIEHKRFFFAFIKTKDLKKTKNYKTRLFFHLMEMSNGCVAQPKFLSIRNVSCCFIKTMSI